MDEQWSFEAFQAPAAEEPVRLLLDLDGYDGPLDVLLALAREQKVDLTRISILALADQYLAFIADARRVRLELAADYLVMAAWLAYLKSKLLLPAPPEDEGPSGEELAAALTLRMARLEAMQKAGAQLMARSRLGVERFARGEPEAVETTTRPVFDATLYDLLQAYGALRRSREGGLLQIQATELYSMDDALKRLSELLGRMKDWGSLADFLPPGLKGGLVMRSALAAHFAATLELARQGRLELRQEGAFAPIQIRPGRGSGMARES